jgi:diguanylate cyclase (GGDEF)-like protein/PAS domain S-box-containing protein
VRIQLALLKKHQPSNTIDKLTENAEVIDLEIVDLIIANSTKSMLISCLIASLLVYLQADTSNIQSVSTWAAILSSVHLIKKLVATIYSEKNDIQRSTSKQLIQFRILASICGAAWGASSFFFFHPSDYLHQAFLAMSLAGICGGAIVVNALDRYTSLSFVGGLMLFFLPPFFMSADIFSISIALMFVTFVLYITLAGLNLANTLHDNIALRMHSIKSKEAINALAQRQKLHFDNTPLAVIEWDNHFKVTSWNASATKMFGYTPEEALGKHINFIIPPSQHTLNSASTYQVLSVAGGHHVRNQNIRKDGKIIYCEWFNTTLKDAANNVVGIASLVQDETAYKKAQDEIERLAYYDTLTNLPNRRLLVDRLNQSLKVSKRTKSCVGVMFMDLDNFKTLNDTKGHAIGDLLLQKVAKRLQLSVRAHDTVARIGGDEFVIILDDLGKEIEAAKYAIKLVGDKLLKEINRPFALQDYEHYCTPSIGIYTYAGEGIGADEVLKRADAAMYQIKQSGRNNINFYDDSMQPVLDLLSNLKNDLNFALAHSQLEIHYQTQVGTNEKAIGAEALLRWNHPELGSIPPSKFIPLAEDTGLIIPIGTWVLQQACFQLQKWSDSPKTSKLRLSVNVSALQFAQSDFVNQVENALKMSGCNPKQLMLELTESLVLRNINEVVDKMNALKNIGVLLSLDDFGMGYSSLSVLKQLPLDELKIDQSFVADAIEGSDSALIIQTIISMGGNLGLDVIAEGVANQAQESLLKKAGCKMYQGYLFGKPSNIGTFETALA